MKLLCFDVCVYFMDYNGIRFFPLNSSFSDSTVKRSFVSIDWSNVLLVLQSHLMLPMKWVTIRILFHNLVQYFDSIWFTTMHVVTIMMPSINASLQNKLSLCWTLPHLSSSISVSIHFRSCFFCVCVSIFILTLAIFSMKNYYVYATIKSWHHTMNAIIYQCSTFMKDTVWLCTQRPRRYNLHSLFHTHTSWLCMCVYVVFLFNIFVVFFLLSGFSTEQKKNTIEILNEK